LCDKIIDSGLHKDVIFKCALRVNKNLISKEVLDKLREAHFWLVLYGVENGNQDMLRKMNKNITTEEIKRAFKLTRQAGLSTIAAFMVGNYGETKTTIDDSIKLMKQIKPDYVGFSIASPFPGSELFRIAVEKDLILEKDFKNYQFGDVILETEELSKDDLIFYSGMAGREYYKMKQSFAYRYASRHNDYNKMVGEGFYWPELWHAWVRRTMKNFAYILPLNGKGDNAELYLKILADHPDIDKRPVKMKLRINGEKHTVLLKDKEWTELVFPVPANPDDRARIEWSVDRTWNPSRFGSKNNDREVGITVETISII
jgi:radical SAM superfamily enzyme YgiQ (UPF0313 family)